MKLLIAYILAAATSLMADTVHFSWKPNSEPDLSGYVLQIGQNLIDSRFFNISKEAMAVTAFMEPHQRAWLYAVNQSGSWSDPAGPLEYRPVAVELVIQSTRLTTPWVTSELARMDETLFDPETANIRTHLLITPMRLEVEFLESRFPSRMFLLDTPHGYEFFHSYVAFRSL